MRGATIFLLGLALFGGISDAALTRGPYLQQLDDDSVIVRWRTDVAEGSRVAYGPSPTALDDEQFDPTPTTEHVVQLDGLAADTTYFYSFGPSGQPLGGGDADHWFTTAPAPGTPRPARIWVLGDSGTANANAVAVRDGYLSFNDRPTDLLLMLGDNAYPNGNDLQYQAALFDMYPTVLRNTPLWPAIGNHDSDTSDSPTQSGPYFEIFDLPAAAEVGGLASGTEAYYSFDYANVHFVVLDSSDTDRSPGSAMLQWLEADLAATAQDWIVAFWHHPPYSKGSHDSDTEGRMIDMRENALPILEDHGVDLVMTGHSHSYERSLLLDGHYELSTDYDPALHAADDGDGRPAGDGGYAKPAPGSDPHEGAVQIVAGSSGRITGGTLDHPVMIESLNVLGSLVLDLDGARLDVRFIDTAGAVLDHLALTKGCIAAGRRLTSLGTPVRTPGLCDGGPPCGSDIASSVSSSLLGGFALVGEGDPETGVGIDSGKSAALDWMTIDPSLEASFDTGWWDDEDYDRCTDRVEDASCAALWFVDLVGDQSYAYHGTRLADGRDFEFTAAEALELEALVAPEIIAVSETSPSIFRVNVAANAPQFDGDPACPEHVAGYRIYAQVVERDAPAPLGRAIENWLPIGEETLPYGPAVAIQLGCPVARDVYLATSVVLADGTELPYVSADAPRIECGQCAQDDDLDFSCALWLDGSPPEDCDDTDPTVYPGAPQICDGQNNNCLHPFWPELDLTNESDNDLDGFSGCTGDCNEVDASIYPGAPEIPDGKDNQCPGEPGHGAIDELPTPIYWLGPNLVAWTDFPFIQQYEIARSWAPDFSLLCFQVPLQDNFAIDDQVPLPGVTFYYLVRVRQPSAGTWGLDSGQLDRGAVCP